MRAPTRTRWAPARSPAPASRSIASGRRRCSASTARPATPTAASRPSTTCSRACQRAAVLLVGLGRVVQDLLLWCTSGVRLPAAGGRVRAGQQHHAAEAQSRGARARARDRAARRSARRRRSCWRSTTRRSATSSTPRTICSRSCRTMFKDAVRARVARRGGDGGADFDVEKMARARRTGLDHRHRAGRHARARSRPAVQGRPRDRGAAGRRLAHVRPTRRWRALLREVSKDVTDGRSSTTDAQLARDPEPAAFRRGAQDATAARRRRRPRARSARRAKRLRLPDDEWLAASACGAALCRGRRRVPQSEERAVASSHLQLRLLRS